MLQRKKKYEDMLQFYRRTYVEDEKGEEDFKEKENETGKKKEEKESERKKEKGKRKILKGERRREIKKGILFPNLFIHPKHEKTK